MCQQMVLLLRIISLDDVDVQLRHYVINFIQIANGLRLLWGARVKSQFLDFVMVCLGLQVVDVSIVKRIQMHFFRNKEFTLEGFPLFVLNLQRKVRMDFGLCLVRVFLHG